MRFRDDNRAQSVQVGAILLFATLVIALSIYQATVVPSQNADVEYKHSQSVQNQMTDVRNGILRSAATGTTQPASITLGTQYPSRVFLMNPPPSTGTLSTERYENSRVEVSNIVATNDETADFIDGSWSNSTKYLEYEPDYNEYDNAPNLVYGETLLYNFYPRENTTIPLSDQLLVNGNTITLVALNGSVSTTQSGSVSVSPQALSGPYERVRVTNQSAGPVELTLPTKLSAEALANRTGLGGQDVFRDTEAVGDGRVRVTLDPGTYTLRTARVGIGSRTVDPGPRYLTTSDDRTVQTGEEFTVSVRDAFNNPVGDSDVKVTVNKSVEGPNPKSVSEDGTVTFTYDGPTGPFNATIPGGGDERKVVFDGRANVTSPGPGGSIDDALFWNTSRIETENTAVDMECWAGNTTCEYTRPNPGTNDIPLFAEFEDGRTYANVDFSVNDTSVITGLDSSTDDSDEVGIVETNATVESAGTALVYASSTNSEDTLRLRVNPPEDTGGNDPSISIDGISNVGNSGQFDVSWSASANGDGDLSSVTVTAQPVFGGGSISRMVDISGESATHTTRLNGNQDQWYWVTVTVTDTEGRTDSDSQFHAT